MSELSKGSCQIYFREWIEGEPTQAIASHMERKSLPEKDMEKEAGRTTLSINKG